jgi:four helix bundle suffix protein
MKTICYHIANPMPNPEKLIPPHGGYRKLKSFQVAQLAYDVTVRFCDRYIDKHSRTHDQMVQAARSGVQNIAEGSQASGTSKKFELKLTSVARASLEELKLDYEDFLRQRNLAEWPRDDHRRAALIDARPKTADDVAEWARWVKDNGPNEPDRQNGQAEKPSTASTQSTQSTQSTPSTQSTNTTVTTYPEIAANGALALITVACSLLDRQIASLEKAFVQEGGFTERLYRVRTAARSKKAPSQNRER